MFLAKTINIKPVQILYLFLGSALYAVFKTKTIVSCQLHLVVRQLQLGTEKAINSKSIFNSRLVVIKKVMAFYLATRPTFVKNA